MYNYIGDCDNDGQCFGNLKCGEGNGYDNNCPDVPNFSITDDCCYDPEKLIGCHDGSGGGNCCTSSNQCRENEGDCDSNSDCFGNLLCGEGSGFDDNCNNSLGFPTTYDCCYDPDKFKNIFALHMKFYWYYNFNSSMISSS